MLCTNSTKNVALIIYYKTLLKTLQAVTLLAIEPENQYFPNQLMNDDIIPMVTMQIASTHRRKN